MKQLDKDVLYHDNHLLVLNKPAGMLTQPALEDHGKLWIKDHFQKPGNVFLHAIHRLDRPVSGIVVCARTSKALSRLNLFQREKRFKKQYLALVEGVIETPEGELTHLLDHQEYRSKVVSEGGKLCRLKYHVVKIQDRYTLISIRLETGRYHQIRAQLSAIGHPVVGDQKYGSQTYTESLFLHHMALGFPHPISQEFLTFQAPLPSVWAAFIDPELCWREFTSCLSDMAT